MESITTMPQELAHNPLLLLSGSSTPQPPPVIFSVVVGGGRRRPPQQKRRPLGRIMARGVTAAPAFSGAPHI